MIELEVRKNQLILLQNEILTSGSSNVYNMLFHFSEEWGNLTKIVCFRLIGDIPNVEIDIPDEPVPEPVEPEEPDGDEEAQILIEQEPVTAVDKYLDKYDMCVIPYAMTAYPDVELEVGVYGVDEITQEIILPTLWISLGVVQRGTELSNGSDYAPPDITLPDVGGMTATQVVNIIKQYNEQNPVQYNSIKGVPEPISNKRLGEILK